MRMITIEMEKTKVYQGPITACIGYFDGVHLGHQALIKRTVETAKENARSVVDIDTVKKVNDDLVSTIEETIKIQREGREKRIAAEQELVQIENRLKEVLLQNTSH